MQDPNWLDELRSQLMRQRLPAAYVTRLVDELSDHVTDLQEDSMSTDALGSRSLFKRLGSPRDVASHAAGEYQRRSFIGRHPILMFVLLPVLTMYVGYMGSLLGVMGVGRILKWSDAAFTSDQLTPAGAGMMRLLCILSLLVPAAATAALYGWLAARGQVTRRWPIIMGVILGILAGLSQLDIYVSALPGKSRLVLGMGFGTADALFQLAKFGVPLLIGLWMFVRCIRPRAAAMTA